MPLSKSPFDPSDLAELVISAVRQQQLQDIVAYVKGIHHYIDPDMFDISMKQLEELEWCMEGVEYESEEEKVCYGLSMMISWDDLRFIETVVWAADEYSHRKSTGHRVEGLTDQGFEDVTKWLARMEDELFRSKLKRS